MRCETQQKAWIASPGAIAGPLLTSRIRGIVGADVTASQYSCETDAKEQLS